jgi:hypothetical protein
MIEIGVKVMGRMVKGNGVIGMRCSFETVMYRSAQAQKAEDFHPTGWGVLLT